MGQTLSVDECKEDGVVYRTTLRTGRKNKGVIEWNNVKEEASRYPTRYRKAGAFVEKGEHFGKTPKVYWQPILKIGSSTEFGAAPGDSWKWTNAELGSTVVYTLKSIERYEGVTADDWSGLMAVIEERAETKANGRTIITVIEKRYLQSINGGLIWFKSYFQEGDTVVAGLFGRKLTLKEVIEWKLPR